MIAFGSFWLGELSPYEKAALSSFAERGREVVLYSYEPFRDLPTNIRQGDAREIVNQSYVNRFITDGRRNITAFSDYFRYQMMLKAKLCWIDADVFMLRSFEISPGEHFLVAEDENNICNAILNIRPSSKELAEIISACESFLDRDLPFAASQNIVAKAFKKGRWSIPLKDPKDYMPIHYSEFYKYLLPEYRDECHDACRNAYAIHLYNNIWDSIGYFKQLLPPDGSYLHQLLTEGPAGRHFEGVYPAPVVRALVEGWNLRFSGKAMTIGPVLKQLIPSAIRTAKRFRFS